MGDYNIVCSIPDDCEYFSEIKSLSEKEKTISFLIGLNSLMSIRKNLIYDKEDDTDTKRQYEDIIRGKEIELNITKKLYNEEKEKIRNETKEEYEMRYNNIVKINEDVKTKINELEKELIKKEEIIIHNTEMNKKFIEMEVNNTLKEKEILYIKMIDEYKNKLNETEKEKYKIKEELREYYDKLYQEKEKELNDLLKVYENAKGNINILELELKTKEENLRNTKELEIYEIIKEKDECINKLEKQIIINNSNRITEENEKVIKLQKELNEAKDLITFITNEKNTKDIEILTKKVDEMEQNNKSAFKGNMGEKTFYDLAFETFSSYEGFDITTNAKTTSHSGDHLLHFKNYTILTDTKNFQESNGVGSTDINKLKRDMKHNPQIKIAWLVSLYKPILKHAEHPYTIEIDQENGICYCYINSLLLNKNPKELLELVWYNCSLIYNYILNKESDLDLLCKYKRQEEKNRVLLEKLLKQSKEKKAMLKQFEDNYLETEKIIIELLKGQLLDIRNDHAVLIEEWWKNNLEKCEGENNLKSKALYERFSMDKDGSITEDMFKQIIKGLFGDDVIIGKSEKTQYKILNWKLR